MRNKERTQERPYEQEGNKPENPAGGTIGGADTACREKAKHVLYREIVQAETECKLAGFKKIKLQALYDSLPEVLGQEADEALWELLMAARRKLQ